MARNIEIKARVDDFSALYEKIALLSDGLPDIIEQDDTFFVCPHGRLKLRTLAPDRGELIFYQRPDKAGPKTSFYTLSETHDPDSLRETLTLAYGAAGRVIKQRTLFMIGQTRLHLDRVKGLGDYLEFEVVLADDETPEQGIVIAEDLLERLGIDRQELVDQAYVDLLNAKGKHLHE
ncbi:MULTISPECIES: class IV adenylate cyclase [Rahnella]|jgi:predicted adenylyl cyclase CyaB|uniref:Adenylate cyclase n=1 Tax=Rahnella sp. (strain Y9602) TaxID=2703885 RepID=A0A0H3F5B9_RAHSY|nr:MULTISPECIES: class IV adenylate cyclase [Rahnella]AFE56982.1 adenylate cyclase [Rahnella aquatilis HX2]AYA05754.1 CYTH domain-containing protein [Rahnella aquatilis]ADW72401.1 adenylate cyclase [Rahnella aceris]AZP40994.1 class IV adenylate cyclase [Rahnella aquatilis]AZP45335.1 class IV adenylate cyclase [Rahnella aquatilis]